MVHSNFAAPCVAFALLCAILKSRFVDVEGAARAHERQKSANPGPLIFQLQAKSINCLFSKHYRINIHKCIIQSERILLFVQVL